MKDQDLFSSARTDPVPTRESETGWINATLRADGGEPNCSAEEGLSILRGFRAIENAEEAKAAREIVARLDGSVLAIELVGAHLRAQRVMRYGDILQLLEADADAIEGEGESDGDADVSGETRLVGLIVALAMASLSPVMRTALEFASFFPPDLVPTHWLMRLVIAEHPDFDPAANRRAAGGTAWADLLERLAARMLLLRHDQPGEPTAYMRWLVAAQIQRALAEPRRRHIAATLDEVVAGLGNTAMDRRAADQQGFAALVPMLTTVACHLAAGPYAGTLTAETLGLCADLEMARQAPERGLEALRARLALAERLVRERPDDPACARQLAIARQRLATFLDRRGGDGDGEAAAALHMAPFASLLDRPDDDESRDDLAALWIVEADRLRGSGADGDDQAFLYYREALSHFSSRVGQGGLQDADLAVARLYREIGTMLAQAGERAESLKCLERALRLTRTLAEARPLNGAAHQAYADAQLALAECLPSVGAPDLLKRKGALYHGALAEQNKRVGMAPGDPWVLRDYALSLERWGDFVLADLDRSETHHALEAYTQALEIRRTLHERHADAPDPLAELIVCNHRLPGIHIRLWAMDEARAANDESLRLLQRFVDKGWMLSRTLTAVRDEALAAAPQFDRKFF